MGYLFVDFSLSQIILWDTVSKALLKSKANTRTKSESQSNADSQNSWHCKRARVSWMVSQLFCLLQVLKTF